MLFVLAVIQFIQPDRNQSGQAAILDISRIYPVPESVQGILRESCYDCHSDNTRYPWYSFSQPAAWWVSSHIRKGKSELNFNQFGSYSARRQRSKLKSIASSIKDPTMPLPSYTLIHRNALLSAKDRQLILQWTAKMISRSPNK
jgi:hypothetical protein